MRTEFGYRQMDIQDAATSGWTDYMIKPWQKASLLDSIDWTNCQLIAE
jgi:sugar (pentulose or hexulose) kinase